MSFWAAAIPAAVGLGSALLGSSAARSAGNAQASALNNAADVQRDQIASNERLAADQNALVRDLSGQARADVAPFRETGVNALYQLADLYGVPRALPGGGVTAPGAFEGTPGYQFRFGEGLRAVNADASARGMIDSGSRLRALLGLGQGMAAGEFGDYRNTIQSLAGVGQTASGQSAGITGNQIGASNQVFGNALAAGQGGANSLANLYAQGGANAASTSIGQANAITSGLNNALIGYAYLNR